MALLLPFFARTALIKVLGADYLGLSGFMASVLQVLNMAELGFSSAIVFSLYKPLAEGDEALACALLNFYRRAYRLVGLAILVLGAAVAPFLPSLISGGYPEGVNLYAVYCLYLANTAVSYFAFAYKNALLTAAQRQDVISNIGSAVDMARYGAQIAVLLVWGDFYAYVAVNLVMTLASNVAVQAASRRMFPGIECSGRIGDEERGAIVQQVKGLAVSQVTKATRNSFDNVFLALFCGLVDVAVYSNYFYVMTGVLGFIAVLVQGMSASVGNSLAVEPLEKNYRDFKRFYYALSMVACVCTACMFALYQPFMRVWVGDELAAAHPVMILFCLYFYVTQMGQARSMYAAAAGLWWEFRWYNVGEALANLLLNAVLGYLFGMAGILVATVLTVFWFSVVGVTVRTFKLLFRRSSSEFWLSSAAYFAIAAVASAAAFASCSFIAETSWPALFARLGLCLLSSGAVVAIASAASSTMRGYMGSLVENVRNAR